MNDLEPYASLGLALVAGFLVGFERERAAAPPRDAKAHSAFVGGARTHPLVALVGALSVQLMPIAGSWLPATALLGVLTLLLASHVAAARIDPERGLASEMAFVVSFLLGAMAAAPGIVEPIGRRALLVLAVAVVTTLLLSMKPRLRAVASRFSSEDMLATLKFLVVAVVVLPLLPDRAFGPFAVLNPFRIGVVVTMIAGIDFVGYVLVRRLGPGRGLGLVGLVGGLVSSTAVTLSVSNRCREASSLSSAGALAIVAASTVMCARVLLLIAVTHRALFWPLALPIGSMGVAGVLVAWVYLRRSRSVADRTGEIEVKNPFELGSALKWAALFTAVLFASKFLSETYGARGLYLAGALAGTTDVDAITLSVANLAQSGLEARVAVTTIVLGVASNTLVKAGMVTVVGGRAFAREVLPGMVAMLVAGLVALGAQVVA